ncbi:family 20 glycosylhydrolase [Pelagicoccus sp. SDUM812005]|uniref:beta-N-acetylhexosaminidase n=1 Tax=Pelagicoccus sp. SDUM812005 TaxID=3041257 RepID=UPI00280CEF22|nr:family 20 glycosylhydrolase [Pelagicoccus sp. SDUM812005]MDQ8179898.1 family 20 glycosylhydrolase [Pelagicoccus sp. SDUM812005]
MTSADKRINLLPFPKRLAFHSGELAVPAAPVSTQSQTAPGNGYTLSISPDGIQIDAATPQAAYHAQATLQQILNQYPRNIPCLEISDWPDLPVRGYMLDISRCKVPTQKSLFQLVDLLASLKYNQLQLYTEHTFAYREHPRVWQDASPLSPQDIQELDAYCRERFIELVPNQNSFGHMERWLRHPEYHHLAESPRGFEHPIAGWKQYGSTLKPTAATADFVDSLFAELLPNFTSRQLNVGGDEPWELGQGYSAAEVAARGKTRVYLDHLLRIQKKVRDRGYSMQFWGDIIINQPELATELGPDITALLWGYEVDHPFADHCQAMRRAQATFMVVPGTSTWNSIGGRLYTALPNIDQAATNAQRFSAQGLLLTDWGDNGHQQSHLLSIVPILAAAERAWNADCARPLELEAAATQLIPHPVSKSEYATILRLSEIASGFSSYLHNQSWLNKILFAKPADYAALKEQLRHEELARALASLQALQANGELALARDLLAYAAQKGIALLSYQSPPPLPQDHIERYRHYWLARNRPGGLEESVSHFPSN